MFVPFQNLDYRNAWAEAPAKRQGVRPVFGGILRRKEGDLERHLSTRGHLERHLTLVGERQHSLRRATGLQRLQEERAVLGRPSPSAEEGYDPAGYLFDARGQGLRLFLQQARLSAAEK